MIDAARHGRLRGLHGWSGICLGLFLYTLCVSGAFALFHKEISYWEDDAGRGSLSTTMAPIHSRLSGWIDGEAKGRDVEFIEILMPDSFSPYYGARMRLSGADGEIMARWSAQSGELLPERGYSYGDWLLDFHRQLAWPAMLGGKDAGRSLTGIGGTIMLMLVISGLFLHRRLLKNAFTLRLGRSLRLSLSDGHHLVGLWAAPFAIMTGFTGAFLGLTIIISPLIATLSFRGDVDALQKAIFVPPPVASGVTVPMQNLDGLIRKSSHLPFRIVITNWGDNNARYQLTYKTDHGFTFESSSEFEGRNGAPVGTPQNGLATRITNAIAPLHFGNFGGFGLRIFYAAMALILAFTIWTGMTMWLEKRGNKMLQSLLSSVCMGLPFAIFSGLVLAGITGGGGIGAGIILFAFWFFHSALFAVLPRIRRYGETRQERTIS